MTELGENYRAWNESKKQKRAKNRENAPVVLKNRDIDFVKFTYSHLRVGEYDFWPGTGKFKHTKTGKSGRGIFNLIEKIESELRKK